MKFRRTVRLTAAVAIAFFCLSAGLEARGRRETASAPSLLVSEAARMESVTSLGSRVIDWAATGDRLGVRTADRGVLMLDPATAVESPVRVGPDSCTALAGQDGLLFAGGADGFVYGIEASGARTVWKSNLEGPASALFAKDGVLYAGLADGRLMALRSADGSILWRFPSAAAEGRPLLLSAAGSVLFAVFEDGAGRVTHAAFRAHDGARFWSAPAAERPVGAASDGAGTVYLAAGSRLFSVEEKTLDASLASARALWTLPAGESFLSSPVWRDGLLFLSTSRRVFGWNVHTGEVAWEIWTDRRDMVAGFVSRDERLIMITREGLVSLAVLGPQALTASSSPRAVRAYVEATAAAWVPLDKAMEALAAATAASSSREDGKQDVRAGLQEAARSARRALEAFQAAAPKEQKSADLNRMQVEACRTFLEAAETYLDTGDARAMDGVIALDTGLKPAYHEVVMEFATEAQVSFLVTQSLSRERDQDAAEEVVEALVKRDGLERTIERLEKALEKNPSSVAILVTLSSLYGRKGMVAKEYKAIEQVEAMVKVNPRIVFNLTALYGRRDAIKTEMIRSSKDNRGVKKTALYTLKEGESIIPGMSVAFPGKEGYSYTLTVGTAKGRSIVTPTGRQGPYDEISSVTTSPNHAQWMALTRSGDVAYMRSGDGTVIGPFTDVYSADFGPDSAYWAVVGRTTEGESLLALSGGRKIGPFPAVSRPVFSADGRHILAAVKDTGGIWSLVREDGERIGRFHGVGAMAFLPGSEEWVCAVRDEEDRWYLATSAGGLSGPYGGVYGIVTGSRSGNGAAFVRNPDGSVSAILADGTIFGGFRQVENYGFSADGSYLAASVLQEDGWYFIRHTGRGEDNAILTWEGPFRRPVGFLASAEDPSSWVFVGESEDGGTRLVTGEKTYGPYDAASPLAFRPDGKGGAVSVREGESWYVLLGDANRVGPFTAVYGAAFPGAAAAAASGAKDRWSLYVGTVDGKDAVITETKRYDLPAGGDALLATAANRACWSTMTARPGGATETRSVFFDGEEFDAEAFDLRFTRFGNAGVFTWLTLEGRVVIANALE